jgi:hypothetical protein
MASGRPAVGALVTVLYESDPLGTGVPRLSPRNVRLTAVTNGRGQYRLTNVPEGRYFVVALPPLRREAPADRRGHAISYFPGALDSSEARQVDVRGRDPVEVDFSLISTRLAVITGVAIGSSGRPLTRGIVQLGFGAPLFGVGGTTLPIAADGTFRSPALPPGVYSLQTTNGDGARAMSGVPDPVMSGARVTLTGADVSDVRVEPIRRVAVRGRVVGPPGVRVQGLSVSAIPLVSEGPAGPQKAGIAGEDGAFEFHTWPGRVVVRVMTTEPGGRAREWRARTVRLNGADVTRAGIEISPQRNLTGVVIELHP